MKIFGIGTDIINIKRMEKTLKKDGGSFKKRVFSENEIIYCEKKKNPTTFFAKRFAAKEALSKAFCKECAGIFFFFTINNFIF